MVVFGDEVTKILRNSLFIFHFVLPILPCKRKHHTESHATKWRKTKNEVTKICDEPGIKFHNFKKLYLLVFHVRLYVFSALSDFEKNCRITGYDDNARHQKSENHEKFLGRCVISPGTENWNLCLRFFVLFCLQSCVWPT